MTNEANSISCADFRQADALAVRVGMRERKVCDVKNVTYCWLWTHHEPYQLSYWMSTLRKRAFSLLTSMPFVCRLWRSLRCSSSRLIRSRRDTVRETIDQWFNGERRKSFYLQLHVAILEMLLSHSEPQSKGRLLEAFSSQNQSFVLFDVFRTSVLPIDKPSQFHRWLRSARCAIDVHSIVDLVTSSAASYHRISLGQHFSARVRKRQKQNKC